MAGSCEWGDKPSGFTQCDKKLPPKILIFHDVIYVNFGVNVWNYAHDNSLVALCRESLRNYAKSVMNCNSISECSFICKRRQTMRSDAVNF